MHEDRGASEDHLARGVYPCSGWVIISLVTLLDLTVVRTEAPHELPSYSFCLMSAFSFLQSFFPQLISFFECPRCGRQP